MTEAIKSPVRTHRAGDVWVMEIDNPPVNATSYAVRIALVEGIKKLDTDPTLVAGVLAGSGKTFVAGADIREFSDSVSRQPMLGLVIDDLMACSKPVVAAIHGFALGGGLELALGCDARIAKRGAIVGLPEVTLGILPAAGGTQRLPRCVGLGRAMQLICSGERYTAERALQWGLVDEVVEDGLLERAIAKARSMQGTKRDLLDLPMPAEEPSAIEAAERQVLRAGKHRPAVVTAIESIKNAARLPKQDGLQAERRYFQELRLTPDAFGLRHQFFAERESLKVPALAGVAPRPVQTVAVIGAGTMGTGIAISALQAKLDVILLERDEAALQRGHERIQAHYAQRVAAGKTDQAQADQSLARLSATVDWTQVARADLVIEAVFEQLEVKQEVFRIIDRHARPGAVLATNTSYLDVDKIAQATSRPQDVLGLHFFSPANVMKLLEVVRGAHSAPDVLATGMALGKRLGKSPVLCGNAFGFVGNRIYNVYRQQCELMLEDGAWPETVDQALEQFGFAMGPFSVGDLAGLDIPWAMRKSQAATRDSRVRYVDILDKLCELGRYGRKTGAGYYQHTGDKTAGRTSDAAVRAIIEDASRRRGIERRELGAEEIQRRAMLALVNEAAWVMHEGIATRASDIDVVLVLGYGFPRWLGGPVHWARQQDRARLTQDLHDIARSTGHGFNVADLSPLLDQ
ncbi:3-hydroxyacyl-CoA dehydrogenase NAD-binding domain-containing protein [Achromobacter xylosoxidans]|nr:3-hydroxyacyl-CoA dehydrogenase NAD-binding domain-containing protein [Achromobacter xylosoxidans]